MILELEYCALFELKLCAYVVFQCLQPFCKSLAARKSYISKFDDNLMEFRRALDDLEAKSADLERKVKEEEIKGQQRLDQVERWFLKFQTIKTKADRLVADASAVQQRRSTSGCCSSSIISTYRCGKKIPKILSEVKNLYTEEVSKVMTRQATVPVYEEKSDQQTVGLDTKLDSTWSCLMKDGTRILGLYGMGGVGKTTLLTLIYKRLGEVKDKFDVVIWVEDVDIGKIQDDIAKRLGLYDENWREKTQREKSVEIGRVLKGWKPRFVLLLDDLYEKVSLKKIGIPLRGREYKIVFTTRSEDVCLRMKANENIKVECLAEEDALDLLMQTSGRDTLTGEMLDLAEEIVKKCDGLPLALKVIGKCLSSKTTEDEWRDVLDAFVHSPDLVKGMKNKMFSVLKVSYDRLEEDAKLCFQYCSLFPLAYNIKQDELVEYWIGEGIIDVSRGRERAKFRGVEIINTLVGACLLLKDDESKQKVYLHNMIREMALWIVSEVRDGKMFIVKTDAGLETLPYVTDWTAVTKMSLMNNEIQDIPDDPEFPDQARLMTLFLQNNKLVDIVGRFFQVMSTLVVLDLSSNPDITKLPDQISELVSLRYLKLFGTSIKVLPEGFSKLRKLIHLDLESTSNLQSISLISGLLKLQVLRFYDSAAAFDISLLKSLERLKALKLLTITVREDDVLKAFLESKELPRCTQGLDLDKLEVSGVSGKSFAATFGEFVTLSKLRMTDCDIKESETEWEENRRLQCSSPAPSNQITPRTLWFKTLSAVVLHSCLDLMDLTWLIYAANLESLEVKNSPKMKEVISQQKVGYVVVEPFQKLQVFELGYLNELESIYWTPLLLPRLQNVSITKCPKLRKLPLHSTSVERVDALHIEVDDGWLVGVEWEDGAEERFRLAIHTASIS